MSRPNPIFSVACAVLLLSIGARAQPRVQSFPLAGAQEVEARGVKVEAVEYKGRKAVRLAPTGREAGLALLPGVDFEDGTIEADVALKVTTPPGVRNPGF